MRKRGMGDVLPGLVLVCVLLAAGPALLPEELPAGAGAEVEVEDQTAPVVALTFDDGPGDATGRLLDGLANREIPATFFLVGQRIPGREGLIRRMQEEGHQIGVHTYDHVMLRQVERAEFDRQVGKTRALLYRLLGPGDYWLRPPYGLTDAQSRSWADGPLILWSVDPEDWKVRDRERIADHILEQARDGDIILLHDLYDSSVDGALLAADGLLERGFQFVTVAQLMELRGELPKPGKIIRALPG